MRNFTTQLNSNASGSSFNQNQSIKDQLLNGQIDKENMRPIMQQQTQRIKDEIGDIFKDHIKP